jgi:4-alpha-glucanotransferase
VGGNWTWRMSEEALGEDLLQRISELNYLYGRINEYVPPAS